ncbi:MAG: hypothetical protein MJA83_00535, partial [Gammaproteobacteria bacterium]|nr:hypothetical protein [Gammaproteobacteria bacterium]
MSLLKTLQKIKREGFTPEVKARYSNDELYVIAKILDELSDKGESPTLEALWSSDFERKPVSVDEFLENDYYLGKVGKDVFDTWRKDLRHVLSPYSPTLEWIIKGSIGCVTGDTKIPLLDGTSVAIQDLVGKEEFWVYSVNRESSRIEVARGHNARKTGDSVAVYKVVLDNGEFIETTNDHRFMKRDGSYVRAEDLLPGDSLMPLYKVKEPFRAKGALYEKFLD